MVQGSNRALGSGGDSDPVVDQARPARPSSAAWAAGPWEDASLPQQAGLCVLSRYQSLSPLLFPCCGQMPKLAVNVATWYIVQ